MTDAKKTLEECRATYLELVREADAIRARLDELKPVREEAERLSHRLCELEGPGRNKICTARIELKEALLERELALAVESAPPIPVSAVVPTDREVANRCVAMVGDALGKVARDYWK